jgi:hypothetical protein
MLMCGRHWSMLQVSIQNEIWRTYRRGQETQGISAASPEYLEAVGKAVDCIAQAEPR